MKERTKEIIKDGFGSLISNAAAIRGAKNGPLWLTIVMFFLSILLPVVPLFVQQANINGSSFLKSYSYGMERYVTSVAMDLKNNRLAEFNINEEHMLSITENGNEVDFSAYEGKPYAAYTNEVTGQYEFTLFLSDATTTGDKGEINKNIAAIKYANGSTTQTVAEENYYYANYMILYKNGVYVCIYGTSAKAIASSYSGDFLTMKANDKCLETLLSVKNKEGQAVEQSLANNAYVDGVYANYKKFLDKSYETLKIKYMWGTSGIYLAIFFGVSVLMGFLMWLLTRGKNNPNNYYSPWLTMKIQGRLGLAPGLITLIVGMFLASYASMIFIITIGLRVMWTSMKELRPVGPQN